MYNFNIAEQTNNLIDWIRDWFDVNGNSNTKAVIGISGGKDSTVVAAACVRALGPERVIGVMMPNGTQADISDSKEVCDILGMPEHLTHKVPSDGMCGMSDEDNLGFTYHEINEFIRLNKIGKNGKEILMRTKMNEFKVNIIQIPCFDPHLCDYLC